jgi:DNA-binding MarR family transcriptional regulator
MDIGKTKLKLLIEIGKHPDHGKTELSESLEIKPRTVSAYIYDLREHYCVVKAPPYDRESGMRWELTGRGKKKIRETCKDIGTAPPADLHVFKPLHTRE